MTSPPGTMNAVRLHAVGDPASLRYERIEVPEPAAGEVLVRVHAAAITRGELEWPTDLPAIPSYEFSGVVAEMGPDVDASVVGQSVFALSDFDRGRGAAAEYVTIREDMVVAKPQTLNHMESAAIPLPALSAWQALFDHGDLKRGERVLIHGASGGVGGFGVQLAHDRGAHVIATASTSNLDAVRDLGADEVIDHTADRFEDVLDPVDLVFDTVGGDLLERSLSVLRPGGRLVSVAEEPPTERAAELGVTASYFVVEGNREQLVQIAAMADQGTLTPRVAATFALADAGTAFARSLDGSVRGKIVLRVNDES